MEKTDLVGQVWYELIAANKSTEIGRLKSELVERGQIIEQVNVDVLWK